MGGISGSSRGHSNNQNRRLASLGLLNSMQRNPIGRSQINPPYIIIQNDAMFGHLQFDGLGDLGDHLALFFNILKIKKIKDPNEIKA